MLVNRFHGSSNRQDPTDSRFVDLLVLSRCPRFLRSQTRGLEVMKTQKDHRKNQARDLLFNRHFLKCGNSFLDLVSTVIIDREDSG